MYKQHASPPAGPAKTGSELVTALETDIIFGRLLPRERLIEDELMERFAATRHKVRQAIVELVARGLVTQARNKGAQVRDYSRTEVEELYEIRNTLQSQAISRIELPASERLVEELRNIQRAHAHASREDCLEEMFRLNNAFHDKFFLACGNGLLAEAVRDFAWRTHPVRSRGFFDAAYREAAIEDHAQMVEALAQSDRAKLFYINVRHTNRPMKLYLRQV
ncbi:GntR family transcriptional regulator [Sulfitobacter sp. 1A16787]|uniref:GntR family transcriptional regulator n=1 Tax=Sulfitobacter sp. 1A16787 TaxID=3368571 RepID=UPI0037453CCA